MLPRKHITRSMSSKNSAECPVVPAYGTGGGARGRGRGSGRGRGRGKGKGTPPTEDRPPAEDSPLPAIAPQPAFSTDMIQTIQTMIDQAVQSALQAAIPTIVVAVHQQASLPATALVPTIPPILPTATAPPVSAPVVAAAPSTALDRLPPLPPLDPEAQIFITIVKEVTKMGGKDFDGKLAAADAKQWLMITNSIFDDLKLVCIARVRVVNRMLVGSTVTWWTGILESTAAEQWTWDFFKKEFEKKYCSSWELKKEFDTLVQGNMSVTDYVERMRSLARLVPKYVYEGNYLAEKLREGLNFNLRKMVSKPGTYTFDEMADAALTAEKLLFEERKSDSESLKRKERYDSGSYFNHQSKFSFREGDSESSSTLAPSASPCPTNNFQGNRWDDWNRPTPRMTQWTQVSVEPDQCPRCRRYHQGWCREKRQCFGCKQYGHLKPLCPNKHLWATSANGSG